MAREAIQKLLNYLGDHRPPMVATVDPPADDEREDALWYVDVRFGGKNTTFSYRSTEGYGIFHDPTIFSAKPDELFTDHEAAGKRLIELAEVTTQ